MSSSQLDSDEEMVSAARAANKLFKSFSSEEEEEEEEEENNNASRTQRRNNKFNNSNASTRNKDRAVPRFLGDSDGEDGGGSSSRNMFDEPRGGRNKGKGKQKQQHESLFSDTDLADVSNSRIKSNNPFDMSDEDDITAIKPTGGDGEEGEDGITIIKKKRIVAKLDDVRLLSEAGFPRLIKDLKGFKVKGKGHELKDLQKLMQIYQLWSHQMFPKNNLKDSLQAVEKLCHKRSVQSALRSYRETHKASLKPPPAPIVPLSPSAQSPRARSRSASIPIQPLSNNEDEVISSPVRGPIRPSSSRVIMLEDNGGLDDLFGEGDEELVLGSIGSGPSNSNSISASTQTQVKEGNKGLVNEIELKKQSEKHKKGKELESEEGGTSILETWGVNSKIAAFIKDCQREGKKGKHLKWGESDEEKEPEKEKEKEDEEDLFGDDFDFDAELEFSSTTNNNKSKSGQISKKVEQYQEDSEDNFDEDGDEVMRELMMEGGF